MTKRNDKFTREARREEAAKRQAAYDKLSLEEKLNLADERPGESARERARLSAPKD